MIGDRDEVGVTEFGVLSALHLMTTVFERGDDVSGHAAEPSTAVVGGVLDPVAARVGRAVRLGRRVATGGQEENEGEEQGQESLFHE